jgi:hypothetical protein
MSDFYKDLVSALGDIKPIQKDSNNPHFKSAYLSLDGLLEAVRPILKEHNLAVMQNIWAAGDGIACKTTLIHSTGSSISSDILIFPAAQKSPQQLGSLITYLKRYQISAFLGISSDEDDDGNVAQKPATKAKKAITEDLIPF